MYILLKTGFSTVLKLTYIQESLKMHDIYAERQCSTRILYAACSEIRSHRDFTPIFSTFPNCIHTAKFKLLYMIYFFHFRVCNYAHIFQLNPACYYRVI